jgi:hypothetical protein
MSKAVVVAHCYEQGRTLTPWLLICACNFILVLFPCFLLLSTFAAMQTNVKAVQIDCGDLQFNFTFTQLMTVYADHIIFGDVFAHALFTARNHSINQYIKFWGILENRTPGLQCLVVAGG